MRRARGTMRIDANETPDCIHFDGCVCRLARFWRVAGVRAIHVCHWHERFFAGWQAVPDSLRGDALCPDTARVLDSPVANGACHGIEHGVRLPVLEHA